MVATGSATQRIVAATTVEHIIAAIAGDDVVQRIADPIECACAGISQVLQIVSQRIGGQSRGDGVRTRQRRLRDRDSGMAHNISVVVKPADKDIGAP